MSSEIAPNFLLIGASRCDTTSVARWLSAHPEVFVSRRKEVFYFSHQRNYARGWSDYLKHFAGAEGFPARGEATTDYANTIKYPWVVDRIARDIPACRLIYMVRHPLRRIESQWQLVRSAGGFTGSLSEFVVNVPEALQMSRYATNYENYRKRFPPEQIKVVFFEDFALDPEAVARDVYRFLGVDAAISPAAVRRAENRSAAMRVRPAWSLRLRRHALSRYYHLFMPEIMKQFIHRRYTKELQFNPVWSADALRYATNILLPEVQEFLPLWGRHPSTWSFDSGAMPSGAPKVDSGSPSS